MFGILAKVARFAAGAGSTACFMFFVDEPKCPKSLIK